MALAGGLASLVARGEGITWRTDPSHAPEQFAQAHRLLRALDR
jgi:hypothetical protein